MVCPWWYAYGASVVVCAHGASVVGMPMLCPWWCSSWCVYSRSCVPGVVSHAVRLARMPMVRLCRYAYGASVVGMPMVRLW